MKFEEYRAHDAVALAGLVRKGEVSAGELLETALARMAQVNPALNAVTLELADFGRKEAADRPTGALAGVPYLLKDLGALLEGTVTSSGSALLKDNVAAADSAVTKGYRDAGLVIFGKTNTPEFGLMPVTESTFLGPCRNPWDVSRTPGGSSGGAASAVAAGIVPAAHASDGGGSIRTPASACGLFGMKPSRGRVSFAPLGEGWGGASVQHAVTRSVRDSAVLLDIACQPQDGDPYYLAAPSRPYADEVGRGKLSVSTRAHERLVKYPWPGNVAELKDLVRRLVVQTEGARIEAGDVDAMLPRVAERVPLEELSFEDMIKSKLAGFLDRMDGYEVHDLYAKVIERVERPLFELVLARTGGNQVKAAAILGLNRNTLRKKLDSQGARGKKGRQDRALDD